MPYLLSLGAIKDLKRTKILFTRLMMIGLATDELIISSINEETGAVVHWIVWKWNL